MNRLLLCCLPTLVFLASVASVHSQTIGYWRFEGDAASYLSDSGPNALGPLVVGGTMPSPEDITDAGAGFNFPNPVPQNGMANVQAANFGTTQSGHFAVFDTPAFTVSDFTIEAFVNLAEDDTNEILYIASQYNASNPNRSWAFGIGGGSGTRDQGELMLVLSDDGNSTSVIESNLATLLDVGDDYYVAATYDETISDEVTFFIQNLTDNGDLMMATVPHSITDLHDTSSPFRIGTYNNEASRRWQGLIDEVRFSSGVLPANQLLVAAVPEPSSLAIFVFVGVITGVAFVARGRKR